jgi:hypothetical protein
MSDWISVSDKLPLNPAEVNYYKTIKVIGTDGKEVFAYEFKAGDSCGEWNTFEIDYTQVSVTHWMHMPALPKQQQES